MRKIDIGNPPGTVQFENPLMRWIVEALTKIARASHEQVTEESADTFTLANVTETRTLDPTTATTADIANVLATLIQDMKNRGVKKG